MVVVDTPAPKPADDDDEGECQQRSEKWRGGREAQRIWLVENDQHRVVDDETDRDKPDEHGAKPLTINMDRVLGQIRSAIAHGCLLYTSPSPRDRTRSRMPSSA